ncbi:MAG: lysine--tRNA ligase, partial [Candidatus Thermoplasmatota archaeon]|nr:lysine--tRNA ligase [Candidatus Thermoplasmatota archaeon]
MHWADVLAKELLEQGDEHVLATGITPSGPIHVGNLREVMTTETVHRAVRDQGGKSTLLYIGDTYDPLRKVYPFLEDHPSIDYEAHVGKPLSDVPCPCGEHESYAHHFLEPFLEALSHLGIEPVVKLAHEMYQDGSYTEAIQQALDKAPEIREILEGVSGRELPKHWLPLNVKCQACGKISGTEPLLYEYPEVEYRCACEHEGRIDVRENDIGKLPWRVDWPARWSFLGVTFEAFGKDHAAAGGSWDTGQPIARQVYEINPPHHTVYEFIHVKGEGAMHSSTGTGIAAGDVLDVTPPEVLRFFFERYQPNKHVEFDPGMGLLDLVDDYDRVLLEYHETGESGEINDIDRVL